MKNFENERLVFEGIVSIRALLENYESKENDRQIEELLYTEKRMKKHPKELAFLTHKSEEYHFSLKKVSEETLSGFTTGNSHGGILAFCGKRSYFPLKDPVQQGFYVMMEGIEDPYNFGYALRSLYAAGVDGVLLTGAVREGADGILCRSSAGASEKLKIYNGDPLEAIALLKSKNYKIVSSDFENSVPIYDEHLKKPLLLIVGGEKRGISSALLKESDSIVRLDYGRPFKESLSAASAASILAFEVYRQNRT